jgi:hypothetical protein
MTTLHRVDAILPLRFTPTGDRDTARRTVEQQRIAGSRSNMTRPGRADPHRADKKLRQF